MEVPPGHFSARCRKLGRLTPFPETIAVVPRSGLSINLAPSIFRCARQRERDMCIRRACFGAVPRQLQPETADYRSRACS
jgi:hypothetical protein